MNEVLLTQQRLLSQPPIGWLAALRENALQQFLKMGFPTTRHEQWKYTNVDRLAQRSFTLATTTNLTRAQIQDYFLTDHVAVILNGQFDHTLSQLNDLPEGVVVSSLQTQIEQHNLLVMRYLNQSPVDAFAALNTAFLQDGVYVYFPKNTVLEKPLQILCINTTEAWAQPRNLIITDQQSRAMIIESFYSTHSAITNVLTDIQVEAYSQLSYVKMQCEHPQAFHIGKTTLHLAASSEADAYAFSTGAALARSDVDLIFNGEHAKGNLYGLYVTKARQHSDHHTTVDHASANCTSHEFYRGILMDKSRAVFNGKVIVRPDAKQTKTSQANHNLLLSSDAEIDTKPELEIYHDDVQCTHGATIGQLDAQALFYLRSRGFNKEEATRLLIIAFAQQVFVKIPNSELKEKLISHLNAVLP